MLFKVLLVNPPRTTKALGLEEDKLGLLYLASMLKTNNIDAAVYDAQIENNSMDELKDIIKKYGPSMVGITTTTPTRFDAFKTARMVKHIDRNITVAAGGAHVSAVPEDTLKNIKTIDLVVTGESEYSFLEACQAISERGQAKDVKGVAFRDNGAVRINQPRGPIQDLEKLPYPARELLPRYRNRDQSQYFHPLELPDGEVVRMPNPTILTARGCPFNCLFCAATEFWGKRVRQRNSQQVVEEIKYIKENFAVDRFRFCDDTFNISKKRVMDICSLMKSSKLDMEWHCHLRADNVDKEMLELMKEAGCFIISLGVESGSQAVLDTVIGKNIRLEKVTQIIRWCDDLGIKRSCNFIYSLPGETRADVEKTIGFMRRLGGRQPFGPTMILPGTRIEKIARSQKVLPENFTWSKITYYKYYDPTSRSFTPIYVEKLTWGEILDIFYKYIGHQGKMRTRNYFFRLVKQIVQIRSLVELRIMLGNGLFLIGVLLKNMRRGNRN